MSNGYNDYMQGLSDEAQKDFQWYRDWDAKLNGGQQMPVANTPTSAPLFGGAATNTSDYAKRLQARGNTGSLDFGALQRDLQRKNTLNTRTSDVQSLLRDMEANRQRGQETAERGLGNMQQLGRATSQFEAQNPMQIFAQHLQDADYLDSLRRQAAQSPGVLDALAGSGGQFAGQFLGGKLFGQPGQPQPQPNPEDWGYEDPTGQFNY